MRRLPPPGTNSARISQLPLMGSQPVGLGISDSEQRGNTLKVVVYLPKSQGQNLALSYTCHICSTAVDPGWVTGCLSIRCTLGDIRFRVGDPSTSSCRVSLPRAHLSHPRCVNKEIRLSQSTLSLSPLSENGEFPCRFNSQSLLCRVNRHSRNRGK